MADTIRTRAALQLLLADNITGDISPQDDRDFLASAVLRTAVGVVPIGVDDTTQGALHLYGANTVTSGIAYFYSPGDADGVVNRWLLACYQGSIFTIGTDVGTRFSFNSDGDFAANGDITASGDRMAIRTVSNTLANNAAGTIGDIAIGTDTNTYAYIWFGTNTPSRVQLVVW